LLLNHCASVDDQPLEKIMELEAVQRKRPFPVRGVVLVIGVLILIQVVAFVLTSELRSPPRIAFMSDRDGNLELYIMDSDGGQLTNLTMDEAADGLPAWSKDAGIFSFISNREGVAASLFRMNEDGTEIVPLLLDMELHAVSPTWSPDGEWIAFNILQGDHTDVYIIDPDGGGLRNLTDVSSVDRFADWSPDGRSLVFTSDRDGALAIFTLGLDGGEPVRLTDPSVISTMASVSPDGRMIAFASDLNGDVEIYSMDFEGGDLVQLTDSLDIDAYPTWSPDGSRIAFLSLRTGDPEIFVMNADGSDPQNLTQNPLDSIRSRADRL
jgi:Tol biopolymer transport system component